MIKMKKIHFLLMLLVLVTACDDKLDESLAYYTPVFTINMPDELQGATVTTQQLEVKDVSSGRKVIYSDLNDVSLKSGLYDMGYEADVVKDGSSHHVTAYVQSVQISASGHSVTLTAFESLVNDDFIIEEIFFTGTLQTSGNQYYGDDYIKIYNNTDHILYADGLTLLESKFTTTDKYDYDPDIMGEAMTVQAIYTIPGSGTDYPVQPGESLILADTGIDHKVANPNSFDLSAADWEWYDVSTSASHMDIDSPTVPNLDKWYCYTQSFYVLHNRGFRALAIARIPVGKEEYLANYSYTYNYVVVNASGTFPMTQKAYKVPNAWIVDAVNCSVESEYAWNVTAPALDRGWTYCGTVDHDKSRYFHSVRRKMLYLRDGRPHFKDTNNSTEDFNPYCIPSMIEEQGTVIDMDGNLCTQRTWDGVIPKD